MKSRQGEEERGRCVGLDPAKRCGRGQTTMGGEDGRVGE